MRHAAEGAPDVERDVWDASSYCKQWGEEMRWGLKDGVQGAFMFRATIGRGEASRTLVGRASGRRLAVTNKEAHQVQARAVSNQMDRSRWQEEGGFSCDSGIESECVLEFAGMVSALSKPT